MKHDILPLAQKGHTAKEIASQLGLPLSTVYYHLRKARSDPPPQPPAYRNLWRNALVQKTYELVRNQQLPYETAARRVIEKCHPERLACASGDPRPVTPHRLAAWTKPR